MNKDRTGYTGGQRSFIYYCPAILVVALFLSSGCSAGRKSVATNRTKERTPEFLLQRMVAGQVAAEWMEAKAKVNFDDGYVSMGATANILLRRDSILWIAVRKLGFEVGRAMITPDSVYLIDRLNNEYQVKDLSYFTKLYNIPANFQVLQSMVLGNPFFFMSRGLEALVEEKQYHLFGRDGTMESHYWIGLDDYRLQQMNFNDLESERSVQMSYGEYGQTAEDQKFSYLRNLELNSRQTGKMLIDIRFSQVEFDVPKNIRFEIPQRYTRVD